MSAEPLRFKTSFPFFRSGGWGLVAILLVGVYWLGTKLRAYRADYCSRCNRSVVAVQYRFFNVLHLFFVPLVPLGFSHAWQCCACGKAPPPAPRSLAAFLVLFVCLLVLIPAGLIVAVGFYALAISPGPVRPGAWPMLLAALALTIGIGFALTALQRHQLNRARALRRAKIVPLSGAHCLICEGNLQSLAANTHRCLKCGVLRFDD